MLLHACMPKIAYPIIWRQHFLQSSIMIRTVIISSQHLSIASSLEFPGGRCFDREPSAVITGKTSTRAEELIKTRTESKRCRSRIHGPGSRNNGSTNRQAAATTGASQPDHVAPAARLAPRPPASTIPVDSRLPPLLCSAPAFPSPTSRGGRRSEQSKPEGASDPPPPPR